MEKLKEDCIITDERLEYMKAIAELYVPNLEAEIYKNICTTTALPIFIKRYNQNKLKEYGKFTYEKYVANKEIQDTLKGLGIDIDKFWFLLLFIFDYTCGTCIDGMKGYGTGIEQLKEAVKAIVENHERITPYGITFKSPIKITVEIGDKDKRTIVIDSPDAIAHTAASIINSINEIEDHPWMQNQRMTFAPTEEKQTIHIWMFYKMFQDFFRLSSFLAGIIFYTREVLLTSHYEKRLFEHASQPRVACADIRLLSYLWSRTNLSRDSYQSG